MKRKCETCTHYNCFINRYCSDEWKPLITLYKTTIDYPAGVNIFSEGEPVKGIYEIYSGKIKVVTSFDDGKERIIRLATSEQILGHRGFGGNMTYPVSAITLEKSQVTFIPKEIYYKTVKANPELGFHLLMFYANELKVTEKRMRLFSVMTAKQKVAHALMMVVDAFGFDRNDQTLLSFTPTRKDIASLAGTTYETVIRVLSELYKLNVIRLEGKSIRIIDQNQLNNLSKISEIF